MDSSCHILLNNLCTLMTNLVMKNHQEKRPSLSVDTYSLARSPDVKYVERHIRSLALRNQVLDGLPVDFWSLWGLSRIQRCENFRVKIQVLFGWLEPNTLLVNSVNPGPGMLGQPSLPTPFMRQALVPSRWEEWATQQYLLLILSLSLWNMPGIALQMAWEWIK